MQNSKFISYHNSQVHYRIFGNGKTVVLLHGFGEDGNIWKGLAAELQDSYQLIIPDIPGSGKSEMLRGENISIEDYAEVIKAIIYNENILECTMIGHSMGGYITLAFAEKYTEHLNGFGLFHSSAFADDEEKKQTRLKAIDFIKEKGSYSFLKTATPNLFAGHQHKKEMENLIEKGKDFDPEALIQYYQAMINRPDRTSVLKSTKKPVLFIIGEKDTAIPLTPSLELSHFPSKSHVNILETGHMGMIEEPEKSIEIIKSFLQDI